MDDKEKEAIAEGIMHNLRMEMRVMMQCIDRIREDADVAMLLARTIEMKESESRDGRVASVKLDAEVATLKAIQNMVTVRETWLKNVADEAERARIGADLKRGLE